MPALRHSPMPISDLTARATAGDKDAWRELVDRHAPVVWAVIRAHRLQGADAADVWQNAWAALAGSLPTLRRPDRLSAWLTTTTRRECLRVLRQLNREVLTDRLELPGTDQEPPILTAARDKLLWQAFASLPHRCRDLLGLMVHAPELTYAQVSRALGLRANSLSRTRGRCLDQLRRKLLLMGGQHDL
jgi:RNA polymerase sigma factor (sigma-70 family)